ncbi:ABC transporter ATP-binding protein, partial [bacterium]|nr:ABC transporter ATP-binding protein [bacterium]
GESGCGKSVTALSALRLIPDPPGRIDGGEILFDGEDLLKKNEKQMQRIRGDRISMIFQEPMTSLNPVFNVGDQIAEVFRLHRGLARKEARQEAVRMLEQVRIPSAAQRVKDYPHQMSGGMRQRVMIAMALACNPDLLIADEPTTALDVTVQARILALMAELQEETGTAVELITHDLAVVADIADHVAVMYAGLVIESGPTEAIYNRPAHPYTMGLMKSVPKVADIRENRRLQPIRGTVPSPLNWPAGCRFHPRCPWRQADCDLRFPELETFEPGHFDRCLYAREICEGKIAPKS